jgi:cyclophilin family peptidyl-prolyl cis-trans isomerase
MRFLILLLFFCLSVTGIARAQTPPAAPTNVVAYAPSQTQVNLSWVDVATDASYVVQRDDDPGEGESWVNVATLVPRSEVARIPVASSAEQTVRYRVAAVKGVDQSGWVVAEVLKPQGNRRIARLSPIISPSIPPFEVHVEGVEARAGQVFNFQIDVLGTDLFTEFTASNLPSNVTVNPQTGVVSGTIAAEGVYRCFVGIQFDGTKKFEQVKYIRVRPAPSTPVVATPGFAIPPLDVDEIDTIDIDGVFKDPARDKGVLISTLGESIILALHDKAMPKNVANFLRYVNRSDYSDSYLHRSSPNFIIQGGGARPAFTGAPPVNWANIPVEAAVPNEPGLSNRRGTIAMAKLGGSPDSATSEWFISTADNRSNLDFQNGGFSAFGEVVGSGSMGIAQALNNLPTSISTSYQSQITNASPSLSGVSIESIPVLQNPPPATPAANTFVRITSITPVEPVEVTVASITPSNILAAAVFGTELVVQSRGPSGIATLTLRATNVDGNSVTFPVRVEVLDTNIPGIGLTSLKGKGGTSILVKGRAADDNQLASWRYRINKGAWKTGGSLKGTFAKFSKVVKGFRGGKNVLELRAFDKKGNPSAILTQRFTLN